MKIKLAGASYPETPTFLFPLANQRDLQAQDDAQREGLAACLATGLGDQKGEIGTWPWVDERHQVLVPIHSKEPKIVETHQEDTQ